MLKALIEKPQKETFNDFNFLALGVCIAALEISMLHKTEPKGKVFFDRNHFL